MCRSLLSSNAKDMCVVVVFLSPSPMHTTFTSICCTQAKQINNLKIALFRCFLATNFYCPELDFCVDVSSCWKPHTRHRPLNIIYFSHKFHRQENASPHHVRPFSLIRMQFLFAHLKANYSLCLFPSAALSISPRFPIISFCNLFG